MDKMTSEMIRVTEEEMMDTAEEARSYDAMDHNLVNARFVADFLAEHGSSRGGEYLDVGTGTALIPIVLAAADRKARILAIDGAENMLIIGRKNLEEFRLTSRVELNRCDAKAIPMADNRFEAVMSNSIVHHIPQPEVAFREMVRLVAPGGTLFVRDLVRPADSDRLRAIVNRYAGDAPPIARKLFEDSLHAALTVEEVRNIVEPLGLPKSSVGMTSDRHWTVVWKRPARLAE